MPVAFFFNSFFNLQEYFHFFQAYPSVYNRAKLRFYNYSLEWRTGKHGSFYPCLIVLISQPTCKDILHCTIISRIIRAIYCVALLCWRLNCMKYCHDLISNFDCKPSVEISVSGKTGFVYHLYLLLNFPRAAILDFMTSYGCPIVSHKMLCFLTIAATTWCHKIQAGGAREI